MRNESLLAARMRISVITLFNLLIYTVMFKITIQTEMINGYKFSDTICADFYDNAFIEAIVMSKAKTRGFETKEVYDYTVTIENNI